MKRGKYFVTTREGVQICFRYHAGRCDGCDRAHVCQLCLGQHVNRVCTTAKAIKGGAGKGGNSR